MLKQGGARWRSSSRWFVLGGPSSYSEFSMRNAMSDEEAQLAILGAWTRMRSLHLLATVKARHAAHLIADAILDQEALEAFWLELGRQRSAVLSDYLTSREIEERRMMDQGK
jgi:hypothetical protein